MPIRSVPGTASVASSKGGKLFAPSAANNMAPLCNLLEQVAPTQGYALEIASGTGQHVVGYAARLPSLIWQPTEVAAERRASIDAYANEVGLDNILAARELDATSPGWGKNLGRQHDLIMLSNLLHLISEDEARTLITEATTALVPDGQLVIYGPFMRNATLTSKGDTAFHASLTNHDPETGYKDDVKTISWLESAGLNLVKSVEMPANNLALVSKKAPD